MTRQIDPAVPHNNKVLSSLTRTTWGGGPALALDYFKARVANRLRLVSPIALGTVTLFVIIAFPITLLFAQLVPLNEVADEATHALRASVLIQGELLGVRGTTPGPDGKLVPAAGLDVDDGLFQAVTAPVMRDTTAGSARRKRVDFDLLQSARQIRWSGTYDFRAAQNTAVYMPIFYLPSALTIALDRALGHKPYTTILTARMANAFSYVALGVIALFVARGRRMILFAALTLPMSLSLAGSCNQDGLLIGASVLCAALLTRLPGYRSPEFWFAAAILASLIAVKPVYFPLIALLIIPALARRDCCRTWPEIRRAATVVVVVLLPALVWNLVAQQLVATPFPLSAYHPGPLWPGRHDLVFTGTNTAAQASVFLHHPWELISLPWHTFSGEADRELEQMVGVFGWLSLPLPLYYYPLWDVSLASLLLGSLFDMQGTRKLPTAIPVIALVSIAACIWVTYDLLYLTWTPVGEGRIFGMQGRYLTILIPFLGLGLPSIRCRGARLIRGVLTTPVVLVALYGLIALPSFLIRSYYL